MFSLVEALGVLFGSSVSISGSPSQKKERHEKSHEWLVAFKKGSAEISLKASVLTSRATYAFGHWVAIREGRAHFAAGSPHHHPDADIFAFLDMCSVQHPRVLSVIASCGQPIATFCAQAITEVVQRCPLPLLDGHSVFESLVRLLLVASKGRPCRLGADVQSLCAALVTAAVRSKHFEAANLLGDVLRSLDAVRAADQNFGSLVVLEVLVLLPQRCSERGISISPKRAMSVLGALREKYRDICVAFLSKTMQTVTALRVADVNLAVEIQRRLFSFVASWARTGLIPMQELASHPLFAEAVTALTNARGDERMIQLAAEVITAMGDRVKYIASHDAPKHDRVSASKRRKAKATALQLPPAATDLILDADFFRSLNSHVARPAFEALHACIRNKSYASADLLAATLLSLGCSLMEYRTKARNPNDVDVSVFYDGFRSCMLPNNRAVSMIALEFWRLAHANFIHRVSEAAKTPNGGWQHAAEAEAGVFLSVVCEMVPLGRMDTPDAAEEQGPTEVTLKLIRRSIRETIREVIVDDHKTSALGTPLIAFVDWARQEGERWRAMALREGKMSMEGELESLLHAVSAVARPAAKLARCDDALKSLVRLMSDISKAGHDDDYSHRLLARTSVILMGVLGARDQWLCSHNDLSGVFLSVVFSTLQLPEEHPRIPFREGEDHCGAVSMVKLAQNDQVAAWICETSVVLAKDGSANILPGSCLGGLEGYLNGACASDSSRPLTWKSVCLLYRATAELLAGSPLDGMSALCVRTALEKCCAFLFLSIRTAADECSRLIREGTMADLDNLTSEDYRLLSEAVCGIRVVADTCQKALAALASKHDKNFELARLLSERQRELSKMVLREWNCLQVLLVVSGGQHQAGDAAASARGPELFGELCELLISIVKMSPTDAHGIIVPLARIISRCLSCESMWTSFYPLNYRDSSAFDACAEKSDEVIALMKLLGVLIEHCGNTNGASCAALVDLCGEITLSFQGAVCAGEADLQAKMPGYALWFKDGASTASAGVVRARAAARPHDAGALLQNSLFAFTPSMLGQGAEAQRALSGDDEKGGFVDVDTLFGKSAEIIVAYFRMVEVALNVWCKIGINPNAVMYITEGIWLESHRKDITRIIDGATKCCIAGLESKADSSQLCGQLVAFVSKLTSTYVSGASPVLLEIKAPVGNWWRGQVLHIFNDGSGARIVRALLLAAAGVFPSWMVSSIARALRALFVTFERDNALAWITAALRDNNVPRSGLSQSYKAKFRDAILGSESMANDAQFKRVLKLFCGGKKKGSSGGGARRKGNRKNNNSSTTHSP